MTCSARLAQGGPWGSARFNAPPLLYSSTPRSPISPHLRAPGSRPGRLEVRAEDLRPWARPPLAVVERHLVSVSAKLLDHPALPRPPVALGVHWPPDFQFSLLLLSWQLDAVSRHSLLAVAVVIPGVVRGWVGRDARAIAGQMTNDDDGDVVLATAAATWCWSWSVAATIVGGSHAPPPPPATHTPPQRTESSTHPGQPVSRSRLDTLSSPPRAELAPVYPSPAHRPPGLPPPAVAQMPPRPRAPWSVSGQSQNTRG